MVFLSICTALYDYEPQAENELAIAEGEIIYVLEKSEEDGWWKAKKKATEEDEDEPSGLIPNNYVEEVRAVSHIYGGPLYISSRSWVVHCDGQWTLGY